MNRKEYLENEIEKTLKSLDRTEKAETDAFFYTRLHARLVRREETGAQVQKQFKIAFAAVLVVLFLNIISVVMYLQVNTNESEARSYYLEEMYDEYGLATTTFYESNNNQP